MSGIKISLKKKGGKAKKPLVKQPEQEDTSKKLISSYSKDDAVEDSNDKPVIRLAQRNKKILHKKQDEEVNDKEEQKLEYGVTTFEKTETASRSFIKKPAFAESEDEEEDDEDGDKRIPVEEFGAAFLRGLGWKEEDTPREEPREILNHRQKGITLGIGAKPVDHEILQDLQQSSEKGIPIIKRRKLNK
ncbi:Pre-mRNA-splicing factor SPP2 [Candida viswanathii]|uniref:Pre-mRNA-splicing factor SPP2 n=1 Tax=Candida viswanathii TaxID=5486 RepID=A0A367YJ70_9ASCO|nr:Pre-mRNA-splicing factor SPP2 [Candida viswanathii]